VGSRRRDKAARAGWDPVDWQLRGEGGPRSGKIKGRELESEKTIKERKKISRKGISKEVTTHTETKETFRRRANKIEGKKKGGQVKRANWTCKTRDQGGRTS